MGAEPCKSSVRALLISILIIRTVGCGTDQTGEDAEKNGEDEVERTPDDYEEFASAFADILCSRASDCCDDSEREALGESHDFDLDSRQGRKRRRLLRLR